MMSRWKHEVFELHLSSPIGYYYFFFSSRRRHTRSLCDWSSDVCSSDLRERRLDRDLGGFAVAHLAHHDDVRVMAQNGAQRRGERQADFGIDGDLRDTVDLVFDGVFHRHDLHPGLV